MDRAWVRLQELQYDEQARIEVLRLTAEMFLLRGWPNRALKPIADALLERPGDPELLRLRAEAETNSPQTDPGIALEDEDNPSVVIPLAEYYLSTGAFLKSQRLLEKLKRQGAANKRVDDLLWALEGDFASSEESLLEFCEKYRPSDSIGEDVTDEPGELSAPSAKIALFPNLFRDVSDPSIEVTEEVEITALQSFAPASDLPDVPDATDDTDILHVIGGDNDYSELDADTFGIDKIPLPPDSQIEEEDDHLIVLNRPLGEHLGPRQLTDDLDTIELDPSEDIPSFTRALTDSRVMTYAEDRGLVKSNQSRWWIAILVLLLLAIVAAMLLATLLLLVTQF